MFNKQYTEGYREGYRIGFQDGYARGRVILSDPAVVPCPADLAEEWGISPGAMVRLVRGMDGSVVSIMPIS